MADLERAMVMSPREQQWIIDKLLNGGHEPEHILALVDHGDATQLPILPADIVELRCASCGAEPWKDAWGRLHLGCGGECRQRAFADLADDAAAARAAKMMGVREEPEGPAVDRKPKTLWDDDE